MFFIVLLPIVIAHVYALACFDSLLSYVRRAAPAAWEAEGKPTSFFGFGFGWQALRGSWARSFVCLKWLGSLPEPLPSDPEAMRRLNKYRRAMATTACLVLFAPIVPMVMALLK